MMTYFIDQLKAAIHGDAEQDELLSEHGEKAGADAFAGRLREQAGALDATENTTGTLTAKTSFDGKPPEMDFLNAEYKTKTRQPKDHRVFLHVLTCGLSYGRKFPRLNPPQQL